MPVPTRKLLRLFADAFSEKNRNPELHSEYGASLLRSIGSGAIFIVACFARLNNGAGAELVLTAALYLALSVSWTYVVRWHWFSVPVRKYVTLIFDNLLLASLLYLGGAATAIFALAPTFVAISAGTRYGGSHVYVAAVTGAISMLCVMLWSHFWQAVPTLSAAVVIATYFLPVYVSQLHRVTRHRAHIDGLTGLLNKEGFELAAERSLQASRRQNLPWAVFLIDLDGFKATNEKCGHTLADGILRDVATRIESVIRPGDLASRWGGDEFAVLLAAPLAEGAAKQVAERIISSLATVRVPNVPDVEIGASIGICEMPDLSIELSTINEPLHVADYLMYKVKDAGKNHWLSSKDEKFSIQECWAWSR